MNNLNKPQQQKNCGEAFAVTEAERQEITNICNNSADWTTIIGSITFLQKRRLQEERKKILDELEETRKSEREFKACVKNLKKEGNQLRSDLFVKEDEIQSLKQQKKCNEEKIKILKKEKEELEIALEMERVEKELFKERAEKLEGNLQSVNSERDQLLQAKLEIIQAHESYNRTFDRFKLGQNLEDSLCNPNPIERKNKPLYLENSGSLPVGETGSHPTEVPYQQKRARFSIPPPPQIGPLNTTSSTNDYGRNKNVPGPRNIGTEEAAADEQRNLNAIPLKARIWRRQKYVIAQAQ